MQTSICLHFSSEHTHAAFEGSMVISQFAAIKSICGLQAQAVNFTITQGLHFLAFAVAH